MTTKDRLLYWLDFILLRDCWRYRRRWSRWDREFVSSWYMRSVAHMMATKENEDFSGIGVVEYRHQPFRRQRAKETWI